MKKALIIIGAVAAVILLMILKTLWDAGECKTLEPRSRCTCARVPGVPGPEDIVIDGVTGVAYVSSYDRRAHFRGTPKQGAIFSVGPGAASRPRNLTAGLAMQFRPHGMSLYRAPDGRTLLFVINHPEEGHAVEIFQVGENSLRHLETVRDDLMISPNDIAAAGPRQFYFTNDHGSRSQPGRTLEDYLRLPRSNIVYFDGTGARVVAGGLRMANGIWVDAGGKLLYASTTTGKEFIVYRRSPGGDLAETARLDLGTAGDNIDVDSSGRILVACHPKLLTFVKHAKDPGKKSPSQVLEIVRNEGGAYSFREYYLDGGDEISAASVAAGYGNRLFIGAVFEDFILDCRCSR